VQSRSIVESVGGPRPRPRPPTLDIEPTLVAAFTYPQTALLPPHLGASVAAMQATAIPFLDVRAANLELRADIDAAIARVIDSGHYILGPEVEAFEREFASYSEAVHCVGVGNGLEALRLALLAMDVGPGDEVIVPSHTYIATWLAVTQTGATPVPVEPVAIPGRFDIDPALIERAITARTRVILPVHLYGHPVDLDPIIAVARRHGLRVLEDAAQAQGARYRGRRIGAHGDAVAWSFYPGKNLGALGDAGAVTTNDPALAERVRLLGNYGSRIKYVHEVAGANSRLDPLQAAVLRAKLPHLDRWNSRRCEIANAYIAGLADLDLGLPVTAPGCDPVWHLFVVRSPAREALQRRLTAAGIGTLVHYPTPPHLQGAYAAMKLGVGTFPRAERLASEVLSLPLGPHLNDEQLARVISVAGDAVARREPTETATLRT